MSKRKAGSASRVAIAFDIDGVFKYGREWSPDGSTALKRVKEAGMPYVFVTNGGGGLTEEAYGTSMGVKIASAGSGEAVDISPERMVLSYTPWHTLLVPQYKDKRVLIVGDPKEKVLEVAKAYGLTHAVHYEDYAITNSTVNGFRAAKHAGTSHTAVARPTAGKVDPHPPPPSASSCKSRGELLGKPDVPFAAILVMCDPYEWYEAAQVALDVLCSPTPLTDELDLSVPMPCHFSNPDLLWKSEHPFPRLAQGAFKLTLKTLYAERLRWLRVPTEKIDERLAQFQQWGKPTEVTFGFLENRLRELVPLDGVDVERFYMIGDNPTSDMEGVTVGGHFGLAALSCAPARRPQLQGGRVSQVRRANISHRTAPTSGVQTSWKGVLVKTGVYKEGDETNGASVVVDGVADAVSWILEQEAELAAKP